MKIFQFLILKYNWIIHVINWKTCRRLESSGKEKEKKKKNKEMAWNVKFDTFLLLFQREMCRSSARYLRYLEKLTKGYELEWNVFRWWQRTDDRHTATALYLWCVYSRVPPIISDFYKLFRVSVSLSDAKLTRSWNNIFFTITLPRVNFNEKYFSLYSIII